MHFLFDEFILEQFPLDEPVFYLWQNRPSVIIGFNQNAYAEVNLDYLSQKGIVLARRVTGGGAVYHDLGNLNYTIAGRSRDLDRDYPDYLNLIVNALRRLGVAAELTGRNDILVDGRKCSGYAKRVPGSKLSAAGVASVRSRVANLKDYLPQFTTIQAFQSALQQILSAGDGLLSLTQEQLGAISREADTKFRTWEWNYGRSHRADFSASRKFSCGTVLATWRIDNGCIHSLQFGGDFLGNLPAEGLSAALEGCRFDRSALLERLVNARPTLYFDGLSPEELLSLFY